MRPRHATSIAPNFASVLPVLIGVLACAVVLVVLRISRPEGEQAATKDYQVNHTLAQWTCRAHAGGGKVTLTSKEIHDLALLYRDTRYPKP